MNETRLRRAEAFAITSVSLIITLEVGILFALVLGGH